MFLLFKKKFLKPLKKSLFQIYSIYNNIRGRGIAVLATQKRREPEIFSGAVERMREQEVGAKVVSLDYKIRKNDNAPSFTLKVPVIQVKYEEPECYLDLNDYLYAGYSFWIYPLYHNLCNRGDVIDLKAEVSKQGTFDGEVNLSIGIAIPPNQKGKWASYLCEKYRNLGKLAPFVEEIDFTVQNHQVQQVFFRLRFSPEQSNFELYLDKTPVDLRFISSLHGSSTPITNYIESSGLHTHSFKVKKRGDKLDFDRLSPQLCFKVL